MRPRNLEIVALLSLLFLAGAFSACGGEDEKRSLLSQRSAARLETTLDRVSQLVAEGDCTGAGTQAAQLRAQVDALPPRTSSDLRDALAGSSDRLESLVERGCKPAQPEMSTEPAPEPAPPITEDVPEENQGKKPKKSKPKDQQDEPPPEDGGQGGQGGTGGGGTGLGDQTVPGNQDNSGGATP